MHTYIYMYAQGASVLYAYVCFMNAFILSTPATENFAVEHSVSIVKKGVKVYERCRKLQESEHMHKEHT